MRAFLNILPIHSHVRSFHPSGVAFGKNDKVVAICSSL